jgi:hypothetical protein
MINPDNLDTNSSLTSDASQPTGGLPVVSPVKFTGGGKGQIATMTAPTGMLMSSEDSKGMLANMEKLLERKPFEDFQTDLQKMYAWTKYDKEPMFKHLDEQQQMKEAQRYNVAQSIAALKGSQGALQRSAQSLISPRDGAAGAVGAVSAAPAGAAQGPINAATQAEIDRLINEEGNVAAAQALRKRAFDEYNAASMKKQFSADMDTPVEFMNPVTGKPDKMTRRDWVQFNQTRPEIAALISKANPGLNQTMTAPTQGKTTAADWAVDNGFQVISGTRTPEENAKLVHHYDEKGVPRTAQGRPIDLKTSSHFTGDGFDVKPGSVTPELEAKATAAGYKRGTGVEENHFSRIKTGAAATPMGGTPSLQEFESGVKKGEASQKAFLEGPYKDLQARVTAQHDTVALSDQVLTALKQGKQGDFGPGTSINQMLSKYAQVLGIPQKPEEIEKYMRNLSIEQARKLTSAAGARAAMGSQFTAQESESWLANFAGINDPYEYTKNMYQLQKAKALVDDDLMDTLLKNPGNEQQAFLDWKKSGARDKIMVENVDAFKNGPKKGKAAAAVNALQTEATQRFGAYEPDKWTYGKDDKGFYREPKK